VDNTRGYARVYPTVDSGLTITDPCGNFSSQAVCCRSAGDVMARYYDLDLERRGEGHGHAVRALVVPVRRQRDSGSGRQ